MYIFDIHKPIQQLCVLNSTLYHIHQICSMQLRKHQGKIMEKSHYIKVLLLNRVENMVAKGDKALYEQFLLLQKCFQATFATDVYESVCCKGLMLGKISYNKVSYKQQ